MFDVSILTRFLPAIKRLYMGIAALCCVILLSSFYFEIATKAVAAPEEEALSVAAAAEPATGVRLLDSDRPTAPGLSDETTRLTLTRAFLVTVTDSGKCYELEALGGTVADALAEAGIELAPDDLVSAALDANLTENMAIAVTRVGRTYEVKEVNVPFDLSVVYTDELPEGTVTSVRGQLGVKAITYCYHILNGRVVSTEIVDETITKEAVNAVRTVGVRKTSTTSTTHAYSAIRNDCVSILTPADDFELDENGAPLHYSKKITGIASAYYWTGYHTCTGKVPQKGYIAVNKNIIPLHTRLFIRTTDGCFVYGYAEAEDTGGFAKTTNRIVDLYFDTYDECAQFGLRNVEVYFLD